MADLPSLVLSAGLAIVVTALALRVGRWLGRLDREEEVRRWRWQARSVEARLDEAQRKLQELHDRLAADQALQAGAPARFTSEGAWFVPGDVSRDEARRAILGDDDGDRRGPATPAPGLCGDEPGQAAGDCPPGR